MVFGEYADFFFFLMHFNNVFSVSFREAGGKLVHTFCFLSILRHSADPHQIVLNCNTQAVFPVTIFVYFRIFKRLFLHTSANTWPCAPSPTWIATIFLYTNPLLVISFFSSYVHHPLARLCEFGNPPYPCQISPRVC